MASNSRDKPSITGCSIFTMHPHPLSLSIDNPAPPQSPHCASRHTEQLFHEVPIGFIFSSLGLVRFGNRRRVCILSFIGGVKQIRSLLEVKILGIWVINKVAVCLCLFDCVVVMVAVYLELRTRGCEVRVRVLRPKLVESHTLSTILLWLLFRW